mmetsp:Transcript_16467/g.38116  ORF Transcript_16467/g.38116 Transcript_16467/m.38116 type:complete len:201 (+) Transcript_16467:496-1098(+)
MVRANRARPPGKGRTPHPRVSLEGVATRVALSGPPGARVERRGEAEAAAHGAEQRPERPRRPGPPMEPTVPGREGGLALGDAAGGVGWGARGQGRPRDLRPGERQAARGRPPAPGQGQGEPGGPVGLAAAVHLGPGLDRRRPQAEQRQSNREGGPAKLGTGPRKACQGAERVHPEAPGHRRRRRYRQRPRRAAPPLPAKP